MYLLLKFVKTFDVRSIDFQTVTLLFALLSVGVILAIISFAVERYLFINGTFEDRYTEREASSVNCYFYPFLQIEKVCIAQGSMGNHTTFTSLLLHISLQL